MLRIVGWGVLAAVAGALGLGLWGNARDRAQATGVWTALEAAREAEPPRHDPAQLAALPEVAQRYLGRAIAPGTPLHRQVRLEMTGAFVMNGTPLPMAAEQVLAPPERGFVWRARIGTGLMRFAGSDGHLGPRDESWTKFWLLGLVPLARIGGTNDHLRAAATRTMLESVWAPATLLPQYGAVWEQAGPDTARVSWRSLPDLPPMHLTLDAAGDPVEVWAMRWSDANPDRVYRLQPFGGRVLETGVFDGFRVPVRVEMGNLWGTPDFVPFFQATVTQARFP
jgi:hypothetical protein